MTRCRLLVSGLSSLIMLGLAACSPDPAGKVFTAGDIDLSTADARNRAIVKIMGSIGGEEKHAFMRFHIYGFPGEGNVIPFFSMNNYIVQKWTSQDDGTFTLAHHEVGYFTRFDTDEPIETWKNPVTGETVELELFVLGPITRSYTPEGIIAPGIAPNALRINVIGDRVFVPAQSIEEFPSMFMPEEWPELSAGPVTYWDSMYTFSASLQDVADPATTSAPAEIHMQNLVSWQPFLRMKGLPGRTMARAWGQHISGPEVLDPEVREAFEKYTPDIFRTDEWTDVRFDSVDYYNKMVAQRAE